MTPQRLAAILTFAYGAVALIGGLIGFLKAGSLASLLAGGGSGVILTVAGVLIQSRPKVGLGLGLVVSLLLVGRFASAALKAGSFSAIAIVMIGGGLAVVAASARALAHSGKR